MITNGNNIALQLKHSQMEVARLTNLCASKDAYIRFIDKENERLISENSEVEMWKSRALENESKANACDAIQAKNDEQAQRIADLEQELQERDARIVEDAGKISDLERKCKDYAETIAVANRRSYDTNSDATRMLNGEILLDGVDSSQLNFGAYINQIYMLCAAETSASTPAKCCQKKPRLSSKSAKPKNGSESISVRRRNVFSAPLLASLGFDTSNLPDGFKLIRRKDKSTGEDVWYIRILHYHKAKVTMTEYKIGRFNIPGDDPMCSRHPDTIVGNNPLMPSIATFIIAMKYLYHMSERRILKMLTTMGAKISQSSLNKWTHGILTPMRKNMQPLMKAELKKSIVTQNDESRIDVKSWDEELQCYKYHTEYIHMALSLERKIVVMEYKDGSRAAAVQAEAFFKDSNIKYFTADRAGLYNKIEKEMIEYNIIRSACWFHARHYLVNAWHVDKRVTPIINLINALFEIERESKDRGHTHEQRWEFRQRYSARLVDEIMNQLKRIKLNSSDYGALVMTAVDYILKDEHAFRVFLMEGRVEFSNNAAERMFRHLAMGRRNWLFAGSHDAAENIAFVFSLLESCNLNEINFEEYLEDILNRMLEGDTDYESMIPCNYKPRPKSAIMPEFEAVVKARPELALRLAIA